MTTCPKPIIPNVFEIVYAKPEDRLLAFADRMAAFHEAERRLTQARAAVAAPIFETTL